LSRLIDFGHRTKDFGQHMFKNYLKIAVRNLLRHKGYSLINITGLAVGMACCLLILFYVYDELSYDRHHEKANRIYRLTASYTSAGKHWACIGPPVGPALKNALPEIEQVARIKFFEGSKPVFRYEEKQFEERNVLYADSTALQVFSLPLVQGNSATALREPRSLLLTQRMARKYFGDEDPMGRTLIVDGSWPLTVTGVLHDLSPRTHMPFEFLVSLSTFYAHAGDWVDKAKTWAGFHTYVLLRESLAPAPVEQKFPAFVADFFAGQFEKPAAQVLTLHLQPLTDIHLYSRLEKELGPNSDIALETIQREDRKHETGTQMRILWGADQDYLPTLGVKLVQGRNFSNAFASDSMAFILNEAAVRELDLQEPGNGSVTGG